VEHDQAFVRVRDSGSGIDPAFLPHVFERFRQERSLATSREPGLGLGLAIVRDLVDRHGGTVTLESEGIGRGTTVTVLLPRLEPGVSNHSRESKVSSALLDGLRLLVVEDDADAREILHAILSRYGAVVVVAESGAAAESRVGESPFDVLVSDIGLPDVSGLDLIKRLRGQGWTTPVIAVTAFATEIDRQRLLGEGFAAHVAKPVDPHALVQAVWLASRVASASEQA
jgi:CheY-like chemotaxis protein